MTSAETIGLHIELLHTYHLDLWTEMEAQLRVLRHAQEEIAKLRDARTATQSPADAREAASMLARHAQTLKGRVSTLHATVVELEGTVQELVALLETHGDAP
jgi:hypothetical protein